MWNADLLDEVTDLRRPGRQPEVPAQASVGPNGDTGDLRTRQVVRNAVRFLVAQCREDALPTRHGLNLLQIYAGGRGAGVLDPPRKGCSRPSDR